MGQDIKSDQFVDEEFASFAIRLDDSLEALEIILARSDFGSGEPSIGAELELFLIDEDGFPLAANTAVQSTANDPRVSLELNRYNLECNARPTLLAGHPFAALGNEIREMRQIVNRAAATVDGRTAITGILPTLRKQDLGPTAMTDLPRYRALDRGLRRLRHGPFNIRINGDDPLDLSWDDVTLEGANASLQLHLRQRHGTFADTYNAAQLATGPVVAAAGNSPVLFGHRLWEETRIALFKQAVDSRSEFTKLIHRGARVYFGDNWIQDSPLELFTASVRQHPPLIPQIAQEDPIECVRAGRLPTLHELRLHHGTVWTWNRAVYDPTDSGHIRIELRALPAGPSEIDMLANAAFLIGLALGLRDQMPRIQQAMPFADVCSNFYRAAHLGLDSELIWPHNNNNSVRRVRAVDLVPQLVDIAAHGLDAANVSRQDSDPLLEIIHQRVAARQTGSQWQKHTLDSLYRIHSRSDSLSILLERYLAHSNSNRPVHEWSIEENAV